MAALLVIPSPKKTLIWTIVCTHHTLLMKDPDTNHVTIVMLFALKGCSIEHISYLLCPPTKDLYVDHILYL